MEKQPQSDKKAPIEADTCIEASAITSKFAQVEMQVDGGGGGSQPQQPSAGWVSVVKKIVINRLQADLYNRAAAGTSTQGTNLSNVLHLQRAATMPRHSSKTLRNVMVMCEWLVKHPSLLP